MASLVQLSDQEFDAFVEKNPLVVVDFWAEWCGPCKALDPIVKDLAAKYDGKVTFAKVDADANPTKIRAYGIMGIPTLLFFRDGKLIDQVVGAMPRTPFEERVKKHLS